MFGRHEGLSGDEPLHILHKVQGAVGAGCAGPHEGLSHSRAPGTLGGPGDVALPELAGQLLAGPRHRDGLALAVGLEGDPPDCKFQEDGLDCPLDLFAAVFLEGLHPQAGRVTVAYPIPATGVELGGGVAGGADAGDDPPLDGFVDSALTCPLSACKLFFDCYM